MRSLIAPSFILSTLLLLLLTFSAGKVQAKPVIQTTAIREKRSEHFTGKGTYYEVIGIGSCGFQDTNDDQLVVALSKEVMSQGSYCGKQIKVTSKKGSVHLKVIDTCPGCARGDVDMSKAAFDKIGDYDKGHVDISWNF